MMKLFAQRLTRRRNVSAGRSKVRSADDHWVLAARVSTRSGKRGRAPEILIKHRLDAPQEGHRAPAMKQTCGKKRCAYQMPSFYIFDHQSSSGPGMLVWRAVAHPCVYVLARACVFLMALLLIQKVSPLHVPAGEAGGCGRGKLNCAANTGRRYWQRVEHTSYPPWTGRRVDPSLDRFIPIRLPLQRSIASPA